ncbi:uncharacterized protein LOC129953813 isoform X2 [Eupeodes corollae]|uniref:uncharacterized protein LOC129953813 isoform X2 n=1 Tax=Eupeodes corollae TaxID=290404 RepID=UPI00248F4A30|nr:uncharacterized protein LOC129953813 isoform X2 [Eupeodes corollae]
MSNQLFFLSLADIFSVYPKIFRELIATEDVKRKTEGKLAKDIIYLPSDEEWLERVYHRLLEVQKKVNEALESGMTLEQITRRKERPIFDPNFVIEKFSPSSTPNGRFDLRKRCAPDQPIEFIDAEVLGSWPLENIAKAAKLLRKPPLPVEFGDEHEMRRVYSLIYDVFRYKVVMSNALTDVSFYALYPELMGDENRIWLMLFELFTRHFLKRKSEEIDLQNKLYREAQVYDIANCLWKQRIRLAASISRMRIRSGALELSQLLPTHLQNEKVAIAAANPIVSGWINPFLLENKIIAETYLKKLGLTEVVQGDHLTEQPLQENQYKWDRICPLFLSILPPDRSAFAQTDFIRNHYMIMQDRTFALAPAIVSQLLEHYELDGDVVQTHVSSPRSTAYLASLFRSINRVGEFLAYGCGAMLAEYKLYMTTLGIRNIRLFAEPFASISLEVQKFGTVVGILATPPNSFSAVADPIDLICSRGGDLNMLQVMTESEIGDHGKSRVAQILEEQRETLRLAMSRPQVQFVLYLTHSIVDCENQDMVERAVEHVNKNAFEKHLMHYKELKRLEALAEAEQVIIPASGKTQSPRKGTAGGASSATTNKTTDDAQQSKLRIGSRENSFQSEETIEDYSQIIKVPKTDEFEITKIPDVCMNQDDCLELVSMGCYIALVQRKEITRLDAKYLIKMAEERGLFGKNDRDKSAKSKSSSKKPEKVEVKKPITPKVARSSNKDEQDVLIQRLNQPTHASFIRSNVSKISSVNSRSLIFNSTQRQCYRHSKLHHQNSYESSLFSNEDPRGKQWWKITFEYIRMLQKRYKKKQKGCLEKKCDDITKLIKYAAYPLYLPCRDRRPFIPKEPYPVTMNYLDFDESSSCSDLRWTNDRGYWTT